MTICYHWPIDVQVCEPQNCQVVWSVCKIWHFYKCWHQEKMVWVKQSTPLLWRLWKAVSNLQTVSWLPGPPTSSGSRKQGARSRVVNLKPDPRPLLSTSDASLPSQVRNPLCCYIVLYPFSPNWYLIYLIQLLSKCKQDFFVDTD